MSRTNGSFKPSGETRLSEGGSPENALVFEGSKHSKLSFQNCPQLFTLWRCQDSATLCYSPQTTRVQHRNNFITHFILESPVGRIWTTGHILPRSGSEGTLSGWMLLLLDVLFPMFYPMSSKNVLCSNDAYYTVNATYLYLNFHQLWNHLDAGVKKKAWSVISLLTPWPHLVTQAFLVCNMMCTSPNELKC